MLIAVQIPLARSTGFLKSIARSFSRTTHLRRPATAPAIATDTSANNAQPSSIAPSEVSSFRGRLSSLTRAIHLHTISTSGDGLVQFVNGQLLYIDPLHRGVAYDTAVSTLISRRAFVEAAAVFKTMLDEGYIASSATLAKVLSITHVATAESHGFLLETLVRVFSKSNYDETALRELIDLMASLNYQPEVIDAIVQRFIAVRSIDSPYQPSPRLIGKLVEFHTRAGTVRRGLYWLNYDKQSHENSPQESVSDIRSASHPYSTLLNAFADSKDVTFHDVKNLLRHMEHAGVWPDASVFNGLIVIAIRERAFSKAFELYRALTTTSKDDSFPIERRVIPDAYTFASMFSLLHKLHHQPRVRSRSRNYIIPSNITPVRTVYHDMIAAHLSYTANRAAFLSPIMTDTVLTQALQAFLSKRDYAGAFIASRAFKLFHIPPTSSAYKVAIKHIVYRVQRALRIHSGSLDSNSWEGRMVGIETGSVRNSVAQILLSYVNGTYDINAGGLELNRGGLIIPSGVELDSTFLERITRRALVADLEAEPEAEGSDDVLISTSSVAMKPNASAGKKLSNAIQEAKRDMVPDEVELKLLSTPRHNIKSDRRKWRKYSRVSGSDL